MTEEIKYSCPCCRYESKRSYNLERHMIIKQHNTPIVPNIDSRTCQHCLKVFTSPARKCNHTRICKMKPVNPEPPSTDIDDTAVLEKRFDYLIKYLDDKGEKIDSSDRNEMKCILYIFKEILFPTSKEQ